MSLDGALPCRVMIPPNLSQRGLGPDDFSRFAKLPVEVVSPGCDRAGPFEGNQQPSVFIPLLEQSPSARRRDGINR